MSSSRKRLASLGLERLETRDSPATLVGGNKVTYQDADGDNVTVSFSKSFLTAANINNVFKFAGGNGVDGSNATKQQLQKIDLTVIGAPAIGTNITTVASASKAGGDGFAALGIISADELGLGNVTIDGDLGRIDCGDSNTLKQAVGKLTVQPWGQFGVTTQPANGDLQSNIYGHMGSIVVKSDFVGVTVDDSGIDGGKIASVFIGGSMIGGATTRSAAFSTAGDVGPVVIKGDVIGGAGQASGNFDAGHNGKIASLTIGGSLIAGNGKNSGVFHSTGDMGPVRIGGNIVGGGGTDSGSVTSDKKLTGVQVGGSVFGGVGSSSGQIFSAEAMGNVRINGDLVGGAGDASGEILGFKSIGNVTIGGSVLGGANQNSGRIDASDKLGVLTIRGNLAGGGGNGSGTVLAQAIASVTVGGSLLGGSGGSSGSVFAGVDGVGAVRVTGDVRGGSGNTSGGLFSDGNFASATIGGSLLGGGGSFSGGVLAGGKLGSVRITGEMRGGAGANSGSVEGDLLVNSVAVGGAIRVGSGVGSASITAPSGSIGNITVGGGVFGAGNQPVFILAKGQANPVGKADLAIGSINVRGSMEFARILAGFSDPVSCVNADAQIGSIFVVGDWVGTSVSAGVGSANNFFGDADDLKAAGAGVKDVAGVSSKIGSITVGGQALGTANANGDIFGIEAESIGSVKIGGTPLVLSVGNSNDDLLIGVTGDFRVHEI